MINIEALDAAIEWAASDELQRESGMFWDQMEWIDACGTAGCIAGRLVVAAPEWRIGPTGRAEHADGWRTHIANAATRVVLGDRYVAGSRDPADAPGAVDLYDAVQGLFYGGNTVDTLRRQRNRLVKLAREVGALPPESDVSTVEDS